LNRSAAFRLLKKRPAKKTGRTENGAGKPLFLLLLLLTHANFVRFRSFGFNMGGHTAVPQAPFGIWEGKGGATLTVRLF
jgi:hypothetical protein